MTCFQKPGEWRVYEAENGICTLFQDRRIKMKYYSMKTLIAIVIAFLFIISVFIAEAQAQSPQQTLNQYIADLQKNPNDNALREKIIRHVQTMKPKPAVPEAAREHYVMAATFVEKAKDNGGYERAIEHYKTALLAAPWWADAYKKQAIVQKAAMRYEDAIASLTLYILTQPADSRDAQDDIYKLKALKQTAAEDQLTKQREEQQRDAPKLLLNQLKTQYDGASFTRAQCSHARQNVCFEEVGMFPCGCNESETKGNNWYNTGYMRISFPDDSTILFTTIGQNISFLKGKLKGPNVNDIVWEIKEGNDTVWKAVWSKIQSDAALARGPLDSLIYSTDLMAEIKGRSMNESEYSSYARYHYILLHK